jgi:integrase
MDLVALVTTDPNLLGSTKQTYRSILLRYQASQGDIVSRPRVQTWLDTLGCAAKTKRLYLAALKHVDHRRSLLLDQQPTLTGKFLLGRSKGKRRQPRALASGEVQALLETCHGRSGLDVRDRALLGLGLTTGMRHGALFRLDRGDIEKQRRRRTARIYLKGGSEHVVPLSDEAWSYLQPWLKWAPAVAWQGGPSPAGPLFVELRGYGRLAYRSIAAVVARRGVQAGLGALEVHELRHTMITQARLAGWAPWEIAAVTGHVVDLEGGSKTLDRVYTDLELAGREWARDRERLT